MGDLIAAIESGKNVAAEGRPPRDGETGIIKVSAVTWGEFDEDESKTLPPSADYDPANLIQAGDFLMSRANTVELVGAPVIVKACRRRLVLSDKVWRLRFVAKVDRWVELFLKSAQGRQQIEAFSQGAQLSMRNISQDNLKRINVPLPPKEEMSRILEQLDTALAEVEAGEAALARAREALTTFRASLLHAAVTGQLTEAWRAANPPTEDGPALLRRILAERRATWEKAELARLNARGITPSGNAMKQRYVEPFPLNPNALPTLPPGWTWAALGQLTSKITSGSRAWAQYYDRGNCIFVMAQNVRPGRLDLTFKQRVDPPEGDADRERSLIVRDDLLITIVGANTGDVCRVDRDLQEHYPCQSVALLRPVLSTMASYLEAYLTAPQDGRRALDTLAYGAGRPHLSFDQLKALPIPVPPLDEQVEIVRQAEALRGDEGQLGELFPADADIRELRQSILHAAFTGRLVPQDPSDEPAAALLARLRATPAAPRRTRRRTPEATPA
jgi:type I restriction enzyme, S subunit